jgi:hypothetical protein
VVFLIWPLAVATIVVAVWLVRHPLALVTVNVGVATWLTFGTEAVVALGLAFWITWWGYSLRWP